MSPSVAEESAESIISRTAQQQADKGAAQLLEEESMTQGQYNAYINTPAVASAQYGTAVHRATANALENLYPGVYKYNTIGPDFLNTTTGQYIELTTPGQVAAHAAKGGAYTNAAYATYVIPK